jgi:beta-aspartyl-peptidase (threonine type)
MKWGGKLLDEAAYITIFDVLNAQEGNGGMIGISADGSATWTFNSAGMYRGAKGVESHTGKLMSTTAIFEE